jgi:hypothetical protein
VSNQEGVDVPHLRINLGQVAPISLKHFLQDLVILKGPRPHVGREGHPAVNQVHFDFLDRPLWEVLSNVRDAEYPVYFNDVPDYVDLIWLELDFG